MAQEGACQGGNSARSLGCRVALAKPPLGGLGLGWAQPHNNTQSLQSTPGDRPRQICHSSRTDRWETDSREVRGLPTTPRGRQSWPFLALRATARLPFEGLT